MLRQTCVTKFPSSNCIQDTEKHYITLSLAMNISSLDIICFTIVHIVPWICPEAFLPYSFPTVFLLMCLMTMMFLKTRMCTYTQSKILLCSSHLLSHAAVFFLPWGYIRLGILAWSALTNHRYVTSRMQN